MGWVQKTPPKCKCPFPDVTERGKRSTNPELAGVMTGDVWQCDDCEQMYEVKVGENQYDGWYHTWKAIEDV